MVEALGPRVAGGEAPRDTLLVVLVAADWSQACAKLEPEVQVKRDGCGGAVEIGIITALYDVGPFHRVHCAFGCGTITAHMWVWHNRHNWHIVYTAHVGGKAVVVVSSRKALEPCVRGA
eukprot:39935-Chlamydomonas_euryale.AAC.2